MLWMGYSFWFKPCGRIDFKLSYVRTIFFVYEVLRAEVYFLLHAVEALLAVAPETVDDHFIYNPDIMTNYGGWHFLRHRRVNLVSVSAELQVVTVIRGDIFRNNYRLPRR